MSALLIARSLNDFGEKTVMSGSRLARGTSPAQRCESRRDFIAMFR